MMLFLILYFVGMFMFAVAMTRDSEGGLLVLKELWHLGKLPRVIICTALLGWPGFAFGVLVFNHDADMWQELSELVDNMF